jgi:hypothetical protein
MQVVVYIRIMIPVNMGCRAKCSSQQAKQMRYIDRQGFYCADLWFGEVIDVHPSFERQETINSSASLALRATPSY